MTNTIKGAQDDSVPILDVVCRVSVVVLFLCVLFILADWIADEMYDWFSSGMNEKWLVMASSVLGGGLIVQLGLKFIEDLFSDGWKVLRDSIKLGPRDFEKRLNGFMKHGYNLSLIVLVSLILFNHTKTTDVRAESTLPVVVYSFDPAQDNYSSSRFPIFFDKAKLKDGYDISLNPNNSEVEFTDGVEYLPNGNIKLADLVKSLVPCGTKELPVRLTVEGYASSQPFRSKSLNPPRDFIHSRDLNVLVANRRGSTIGDKLNEEIDKLKAEDRVRITVDKVAQYNNLKAMENLREFNDRPYQRRAEIKGSGPDSMLSNSPPQDFFTRVAHIKVDIANCRHPRRLVP